MTTIINRQQIEKSDFFGIDFVFAVSKGDRLWGVNIGRPGHYRPVQLFFRESSDLMLIEVDDISDEAQMRELRAAVLRRRIFHI